MPCKASSRTAPPRPSPAGAKRGPGRPKAGRRGSVNVDEAAAKIAAHVQANDGQGISAIADATGVALPVAKKAAGQLIAAGTLKKTGKKRGTVYHVGSGRKPRVKKAAKRGKRKASKARKAKKAKAA